MAWQENLANAMASPRKLQHNTTKKIKKWLIPNTHTYRMKMVTKVVKK